MDYKQSLQLCIKDLKKYSTADLLLMGKYYRIYPTNKRHLCKILGEQFIGKIFHTAQMPPIPTSCSNIVKYWKDHDAPDYVQSFVDEYIYQMCDSIIMTEDKNSSEPRDIDVLNRHALFATAAFNIDRSDNYLSVLKYATELELDPYKYKSYTFYGFEKGKSLLYKNIEIKGFINTFFKKGIHNIYACDVNCFNWILDYFKPEIVGKYANISLNVKDITPMRVEHEELETNILEWAQHILENSIDLVLIKAILDKLGNK